MRIRALRPHRNVFVNGSERWHCGVLWQLSGDVATIRIYCAPGVLRNFPIERALLPNPASDIGCPFACRLDGEGAEQFTLAELRGTHWGGGGPGADERGAVERGQFYMAVIPREITLESDEYPWTAGI